MGRQRCCASFAIMSREEPISGSRNNNDDKDDEQPRSARTKITITMMIVMSTGTKIRCNEIRFHLKLVVNT